MSMRPRSGGGHELVKNSVQLLLVFGLRRSSEVRRGVKIEAFVTRRKQSQDWLRACALRCDKTGKLVPSVIRANCLSHIYRGSGAK